MLELKKADFQNIKNYLFEFKKIDQFYFIHKKGYVYSNKTNKILKAGITKNGYLTVSLNKKTFYIHQLVAENFTIKENENLVVNHIDGNKLNNHYKNLEYVTSSENNSHAIKTGLKKPINTAKGIIKYDMQMNEIARYRTTEDVGFPFYSGCICQVANGKRKSHKGHIFKYINN